MNLQLLDDSGIDGLYFEKKRILIHSILKPVLTMSDGEGKSMEIYSGRRTDELLDHYDKSLITQTDKLYNRMIYQEQIFLIQLVEQSDLALSWEAGYWPDAIFSVFKDEMLKVSPVLTLSFMVINPKEYIQQKFN